MCRFVVYIGTDPIYIKEAVTKPDHSLIQQSKHGEKVLRTWIHFHNCHELENFLRINPVINGDGFGLGWYSEDAELQNPAIFKSMFPAWSDKNLVHIADCVKSKLFFAHLREASPGSPVNELNCHPFTFGRLMWMQNGDIANFKKIQRKLLQLLTQETFEMITGSTDGEHGGALFMECLPKHQPPYSPDELAEAMTKCIALILELIDVSLIESEIKNSHENTHLNFTVSDGDTIVATRFRDSVMEEPPTLFYTIGNSFKTRKMEENAKFITKTQTSNPNQKSVLIASEPLNYDVKEWILVPKNHMLIISKEKCEVRVESIHLPREWAKNFRKMKENDQIQNLKKFQ